jgi:tRNA G37 N-methylase Trm5
MGTVCVNLAKKFVKLPQSPVDLCTQTQASVLALDLTSFIVKFPQFVQLIPFAPISTGKKPRKHIDIFLRTKRKIESTNSIEEMSEQTNDETWLQIGVLDDEENEEATSTTTKDRPQKQHLQRPPRDKSDRIATQKSSKNIVHDKLCEFVMSHLTKANAILTTKSTSSSISPSIEQSPSISNFTIGHNTFTESQLRSLLPNKFEKFGHACILKNVDRRLLPMESLIADAFIAIIPGVRLVAFEECGIQGELREPTVRVIVASTSSSSTTLSRTEVIHIENKIRYCFDITKCKFSSGNNAERIHFSTIDARSELIVDMFAGIGYFSLPLARCGRPRQLVAIEKNPNSHHYLQRNAVLNGVDDVLLAVLGDCRTAAQEFVGKADRISM